MNNYKLIRDNIEPDKGEVIICENDTVYKEALYAKLFEEVKELDLDRTLEEAADVLEVLVSIGELEGWTMADISDAALSKSMDKGTFEKRKLWQIQQ